MLVKTIKISNFSGGEATNPDAGDLAGNVALEARNVDLTQFPGCLYKATGTSLFDFNGELPLGLLPAGEEILSVGSMVYNKVWDGSVKVNRPTELVIVQVKDTEHDFAWYELERAVDGGTWVLSPAAAPPYYIGWNHDTFEVEGYGDPLPIFETTWGVSNAHLQRARWLSDRGVLRAALGNHLCESVNSSHPMFNKSDSFPIQWRYVNRSPQQVIEGSDNESNGYFKDFDITSGDYLNCLIGDAQTGICRSVGLPKYNSQDIIVNIESPASGGSFFCLDGFGYSTIIGTNQIGDLSYLLLPVFDGHQIGFPQEDPLIAQIMNPVLSQGVDYSLTRKFQITLQYTPSPIGFPKRLSGFKLFRGGMTAYMNYTEIANIDIRDGVENIFVGWGQVVDHTGTNQYVTQLFSFTEEWHDIFATYGNDLYNNLFIRIYNDDNTWKEYKIYDSEWSRYNDNVYTLKLYYDAGAYPISIGDHRYKVNSRWYADGNTAIIDILDPNVSGGTLPFMDIFRNVSEWLPIDCNYSQARIFKDQMWTSGVAHDDEKKPLMMRYSNPVNSTFAGFDIQPNYLIPPAEEDDEVICVRPYLDFLLVGTKRKLFKYLLSGGQTEVLAEMPWDAGVNAIDAYVEVDAVSYFVGRRGDRKVLYIWDGSGKPKALDHVRKEIEDILNSPDINLALTQAVPLLRDDKVLFSIPTATEGEEVYEPRWSKINDTSTNGLHSVGGNYVTQKTLGILPRDIGDYPAGTIIIGVVDNDPVRLTHTRKFYAQKPNETGFTLVWTWPGLTGEGSKDPTMSFVVSDDDYCTIHAVTTWQNLAQTSNIVYYNSFSLDGSFGVNNALETLGVSCNQYFPDIDVDPSGGNRLVAVWNSYQASINQSFVNKMISSSSGSFWAFARRSPITDVSSAPSVAFDPSVPETIYFHVARSSSLSRLFYGNFGMGLEQMQLLCDVNMPNACMCLYEGRVGFLDIDDSQNLTFRYWMNGDLSDAEIVATGIDNANNYALTYKGSDADRKWCIFYQTDTEMMLRTRPIDSTIWDDPIGLSPEDLYPNNATFDHFGTLNSRRPPVANADHAHVWAINSTANGSGDHYDFWYRAANMGELPTTLHAANLEIDKNGAVMLRGDGVYGKMSTVLAIRGWTRLSDESILYHNNSTFYRFAPDTFAYGGNPVVMYWRQIIPGGQGARERFYAIRPVFEYLDQANAAGFTITIENENGVARSVNIATTDSGKLKKINLVGREFTWSVSHSAESAVKFRELEIQIWSDQART